MTAASSSVVGVSALYSSSLGAEPGVFAGPTDVEAPVDRGRLLIPRPLDQRYWLRAGWQAPRSAAYR